MSDEPLLKLIVGVSGSNYLTSIEFDYMRVELDAATRTRIHELAAEATRLKVYKIVEFDYRAQPLKASEDGSEDDPSDLVDADVRTECDCMNVTDRGVFWSGYEKYSEIRWETDSIPLDFIANAEVGTHDLRT
jgi:hypothetical protein